MTTSQSGAAGAGLIGYRKDGPIAVLALDDPPANAYTHEMMRDLDAAILRARFDPDVQVIILRGAGEKFFCGGANIRMLNEVDATFRYYFMLHTEETLSRLEQTPKLVIAALNGHCVGGGLEIALAADLRIARQGPAKIGFPEVNLGLLPSSGGSQRLAKLVGKPRAIELMAMGRTFPTEEALALGLVTEVLPARDWWEHVLLYARQFCLPNKAALAVGQIKRAVQSGAELPLQYGMALERELQNRLLHSEDANEGLRAYVEKRQPRFRGR